MLSNVGNDKEEKKKYQLNESFEPGAARFGNFINYYSFNSVSKRLNAIPTDLLSQLNLREQPILCLDIGCNSGDLTIGLYSHLISPYEEKPELHILGIDLDDVLITRSKESNLYSNHITFQRLNIMEESSLVKLVTFLQKYGKTEFEVISCFSTTMWIHLNYGDNGLENFFRTVSGITKYLLLEPQEWKCYKAAVRRMTRLNREVFAIKKLKINDVITYLISFLDTQCNMELQTCYGETSWGRKMYLFKKRSIS